METFEEYCEEYKVEATGFFLGLMKHIWDYQQKKIGLLKEEEKANVYILCEKERTNHCQLDKIKDLEKRLALAVEGLIFYSDLKEYEETHDQLDWTLVNNPSAIQEKGMKARKILAVIK